MTNNQYISKAVLVQLQRKGMTKRDLAAKLDISYSYLLKLLNDCGPAWNIRLMDKAAAAVGLPDAFTLMDRASYERSLEQAA